MFTLQQLMSVAQQTIRTTFSA